MSELAGRGGWSDAGVRSAPGFDTTWGFGLIDAFAAAKRAGQ